MIHKGWLWKNFMLYISVWDETETRGQHVVTTTHVKKYRNHGSWRSWVWQNEVKQVKLNPSWMKSKLTDVDTDAENICPTSHQVPIRPRLKYYIQCHVAWRWTGTLCRYSNTRFMSQFCCCHTVSLINHKTVWSLNYPNSLVSGGKSSSAALIHTDRKSMQEKLSLTLKHTAAH